MAERRCGDRSQFLPSEILAECFALIDLRDLISASHVSSYWRASALAFPAIWTDIFIQPKIRHPHEILRMAISRAGELPVDFQFSSPVPNMPLRNSKIIAVVAENMHRFRSFIWEWEIGAVDLTVRAPLLEEFVFSGSLFPIPIDFLGGVSGRLRRLRLNDTLFPNACPALETVTHLRVSCPRYIYVLPHFELIFALCPRLEVLNLRTICSDAWNGLPAAPFPPTLKVVKLHAQDYCDPVQRYTTWAQGVYLPQVRLKMPLAQAYTVAPFLEGALDVAVMLEGTHKARIVADMSDARRHTLAFFELDQVLEPAGVLAQILRELPIPATLRSLRVPLSALNLVLSTAPALQLPAVIDLQVDMFTHDAYDTTPYKFGETYERFRWSTLACLCALPERFPALTALSLVLHGKEQPTLEDACELLQYVSTHSPHAGAFPVARVHGFPADVVHAVAAGAPDHPWVPFAL